MAPVRAGPGVRLTLSVRGQRGLAANLFRVGQDITDAIVLETFHAGEAVRAVAQEFAPKDWGFMADQIETRYSPHGLAFEVGYDDAAFVAAGLEPYYWYQELGFTHYQTGQYIRNPHLEPAYRVVDPAYRAGVRAAAQAAIRRVSGQAATRGVR